MTDFYCITHGGTVEVNCDTSAKYFRSVEVAVCGVGWGMDPTKATCLCLYMDQRLVRSREKSKKQDLLLSVLKIGLMNSVCVN